MSLLRVLCLLLSDFNSIKVRLERSGVIGAKPLKTFQFHKGAIRTVVVKLNLLLILNFNSIKVRLEHTFTQFLRIHYKISIP